MSRLCSHRQYIAMTMSAPTSTPLPPNPRKLANKQRRQAGRERHEERKTQTKEIASQRRWQSDDRPGLQEQLRNDGTLAFAGRNLYNIRGLASHIRGDSDTEDDDEVDEAAEMVEDVPLTRSTTSGAALLAMARPAKTRRPPLADHGRRVHSRSWKLMVGSWHLTKTDGRFYPTRAQKPLLCTRTSCAAARGDLNYYYITERGREVEETGR
ncbi:hypothetical protein BJY52DRAFT_1223199 [Lactarius psammicola]|nr:hypothetical protein BJY52DRAFT_1223199 [Lactarius psammicola]